MARIEADKEDLIEEASALVERAEFLRLDGDDSSDVLDWKVLTIGFRRNGYGSIYLDQTSFYQFDAACRLRRAHVGGSLFRSQGSTLAKIDRDRSTGQTILRRVDLTVEDVGQFREHAHSRLRQVAQLLQAGSLQCTRRVPEDFSAGTRAADLLEEILKRDYDGFLAPQLGVRS